MILGVAIILAGGLWYLSATPKKNVSVSDPAAGAHVVIGKKSAPVTVVEFSNYLCPHCKHHAELSLPLIIKNYVDTGKVRYIFRDLPFAGQDNVELAAEAADCAFDQGRYLEYHEALFRANGQWAKLATADLSATFSDYARQLGLDVNRFEKCLSGHEKRPWVEEDKKMAEDLGVNGTPSFFINGKHVEGFRPFDKWRELLSEAMGAK